MIDILNLGAIALPHSFELDVGRYRSIEVIIGTIELPALEGFPLLGGHRRLVSGPAALDLLARHRRAAIGVEGHTAIRGLATVGVVATLLFPHGRKLDIGGHLGLEAVLLAAELPLLKGEVLLGGILGLGCGLTVLDTLLRIHLAAAIAVERHRELTCVPAGIDRDVLGHRRFEVVAFGARLVLVPGNEGIAILGRVRHGLVGHVAVLNHLRLNHRAALGIKGHRMRGGLIFPLGVERNVLGHRIREIIGFGELLVGIPAGENLSRIRRRIRRRSRTSELHRLIVDRGRTAVGLELHRVALDIPTRIERDVRGHRRIEVVLVLAALVRVPAGEPVALALDLVVRGRLALSHLLVVDHKILRLIGHQAPIARIGGIATARVLAPFGHKRRVAVEGRVRVDRAVRRLIGIIARLDVPPEESKAIARRLRQIVQAPALNQRYRALLNGSATIGIKRHRYEGSPSRIELEIRAHALVEVVGIRAILVRVPAAEQIALARGRVFGHRNRLVVLHRLRIRLRHAALGIERHGIGLRRPHRIKGEVGRNLCIIEVERAALLVVPTDKLVALAHRRIGSRHLAVVFNRLIVNRRAAVSLELHRILLGLPLGREGLIGIDHGLFGYLRLSIEPALEGMTFPLGRRQHAHGAALLDLHRLYRIVAAVGGIERDGYVVGILGPRCHEFDIGFHLRGEVVILTVELPALKGIALLGGIGGPAGITAPSNRLRIHGARIFTGIERHVAHDAVEARGKREVLGDLLGKVVLHGTLVPAIERITLVVGMLGLGEHRIAVDLDLVGFPESQVECDGHLLVLGVTAVAAVAGLHPFTVKIDIARDFHVLKVELHTPSVFGTIGAVLGVPAIERVALKRGVHALGCQRVMEHALEVDSRELFARGIVDIEADYIDRLFIGGPVRIERHVLGRSNVLVDRGIRPNARAVRFTGVPAGKPVALTHRRGHALVIGHALTQRLTVRDFNRVGHLVVKLTLVGIEGHLVGIAVVNQLDRIGEVQAAISPVGAGCLGGHALIELGVDRIELRRKRRSIDRKVVDVEQALVHLDGIRNALSTVAAIGNATLGYRTVPLGHRVAIGEGRAVGGSERQVAHAAVVSLLGVGAGIPAGEAIPLVLVCDGTLNLGKRGAVVGTRRGGTTEQGEGRNTIDVNRSRGNGARSARCARNSPVAGIERDGGAIGLGHGLGIVAALDGHGRSVFDLKRIGFVITDNLELVLGLSVTHIEIVAIAIDGARGVVGIHNFIPVVPQSDREHAAVARDTAPTLAQILDGDADLARAELLITHDEMSVAFVADRLIALEHQVAVDTLGTRCSLGVTGDPHQAAHREIVIRGVVTVHAATLGGSRVARDGHIAHIQLLLEEDGTAVARAVARELGVIDMHGVVRRHVEVQGTTAH